MEADFLSLKYNFHIIKYVRLFMFLFFGWDWDLDLGLYACKAGTTT
jgi:hypothetical protein